MSAMNNTYYIYAYLRNKGSETAQAGMPYYIGKGTGRRAFVKHGNGISKPNDKSKIIILESNLTEIGAFALERRLIKWWGRKDIKTGILLNRSDGGEGRSGHKHSEEVKAKMSAAKKGKPLSKEHSAKISAANKGRAGIGKGVPRSAEVCAKISKSSKGRKFSAERCEQMSKSRLGKCYLTEESIKKIVLAQTGVPKKKWTEEQKTRLSAGKTGVKRGPYKKAHSCKS